MAKERMLTVKVPIHGTEDFIQTVEVMPTVESMEEDVIYAYNGVYYRRIDDERVVVTDVEFPTIGKPLELFDFTYEATRMGTAPMIQASVHWYECLDDFWTQDCYVEFNGEKFYLKLIPTSSKDNEDARYKHEILFVSERVILEDVYFFDIVTPYISDRPVSESSTFSFYGDIKDFAHRLNASLARSGLAEFKRKVDDNGDLVERDVVSYDTWQMSKIMPFESDSNTASSYSDYEKYLRDNVFTTHTSTEVVDGTETQVVDYDIEGYQVVLGADADGNTVTSEEKLLEFENNTIHEALQKIKDEFELSYYFTTDENGNKLIVVGDGEYNFGEDNAFAYGVDNALLSIEKANTTEKIVTRITGVGSSENIPWYYPNPTPDGWLRPVYRWTNAAGQLMEKHEKVNVTYTEEHGAEYEKFLKNRLGNNFVFGFLTETRYVGTDALFVGQDFSTGQWTKAAVYRNDPDPFSTAPYPLTKYNNIKDEDDGSMLSLEGINDLLVEDEHYFLTFEVDEDDSYIVFDDIKCLYNPASTTLSIKKLTTRENYVVKSEEDEYGNWHWLNPSQCYKYSMKSVDLVSPSGVQIPALASNSKVMLDAGTYLLDMKVHIDESNYPQGRRVDYIVILADPIAINECWHSVQVNNIAISFRDDSWIVLTKDSDYTKVRLTLERGNGIYGYYAYWDTSRLPEGSRLPVNEGVLQNCRYIRINPQKIYNVDTTAQKQYPTPFTISEVHEGYTFDIVINSDGTYQISEGYQTVHKSEFYKTYLQGTLRAFTKHWTLQTKSRTSVIDLADYALSTTDTPNLYDQIVFQRARYLIPQTNLMPEIYINSAGQRRFYEAKQYRFPTTIAEADVDYTATPDTEAGETSDSVPAGIELDSTVHGLHNTLYQSAAGNYYIFENLCLPQHPKEHIENFDDIKPSIEGMKNSSGRRIDVVEEFAYDTYDDDSIWEDGGEQGEYKHPHFFAKLRPLGFNIFDLASTEDMVMSFTTGGCGACNFKIKTIESTKKNPIQVWDTTLYKINNDADEGEFETSSDTSDTNKYIVYIKKGSLKRYGNYGNVYVKANGKFLRETSVVGEDKNATTDSGFSIYSVGNVDGAAVERGEIGSLNASGWRHIEGDVVLTGRYNEDMQDTSTQSVWVVLEKDTETYGTIMPSAQIVYADASYAIYIRPKAASDINGSASTKEKDADKFVLLNIRLPQLYLRQAEHKLSRALVNYMYENNAQKYNFSIKFSRIFLAQNEDVESKLNENSVMYVRYNNTSKKYKQYVSHYTYKMSPDTVLPEISVEMNEETSVYRNLQEQQRYEQQQNRFETIEYIEGTRRRTFEQMRSQYVARHQDLNVTGDVYSSVSQESIANLTERAQALVQSLSEQQSQMNAEVTAIKRQYTRINDFDLKDAGLSILGQNVISMVGTKRIKVGDEMFAPSFIDSDRVKLETFGDEFKALVEKPDDWATQYTSYYKKVDDEYVALSVTEAPAFEAGEYYKIDRDAVVDTLAPARIDASTRTLTDGLSTITPWENSTDAVNRLATNGKTYVSGTEQDSVFAHVGDLNTLKSTVNFQDVKIDAVVRESNYATSAIAETIQNRFMQNGTTSVDSNGNYIYSYVDNGITKTEYFWYETNRTDNTYNPKEWDSNDTSSHKYGLISSSNLNQTTP